MKKINLLLILLLFFIGVQAQMTVNNGAPYNTAAYLVNNVLLGNGVMASNITFAGQPQQIGFFYGGLNGAPNLGIDSGIVISSGDVNDIPPGGNQPNIGQYNGPGDPDLLTIAQSVSSNPSAGSISATLDGAFLEFDFTPIGDTVKFNFVFASEEYTTYINTVYNDIFAFFISGPGITGPYASPAGFPGGSVNIAQIPSTTTPITISSIHPGLNSQYYISNSTEQNHEFNGFTTVMSIAYPVQCGQLYHFKIAVADCQDDYLDTGVFLEASSFSSTAVQVSVVTATGDSTVIEGCAGATLNFTRPDTNGLYTVHFDINGNAINGTDYNFIADSVTFQPGFDTTSLTITPIADAIPEGTDTILITVYTINACGDTIISEGVIYILDLPNMFTNAPDTNLACPLGNIPISVSAWGAVPPYTYAWTNSSGSPIGNTPTINVSGLQTDTFYVDVTDSCNLLTLTDTVIVTLNIPPLTLSITPDTLICAGDTVTLTATAGGGQPGYNYVWTPGGATTPSITVNPMTTTSYYVALTDMCNTITYFDTVEVNTNYVPMTLEIPAVESVCIGDPMEINALVYNGMLPYAYSWSDGINTYTNNPFSYPTDAANQSILTFTVTDRCGNTEMGNLNVEVIACNIIVPNVITPNGDGMNDYLMFENLEYFPNNRIQIFNRWGQLLYDKDGYQNDWDGDKYSDGTYFFILELNNKNSDVYKQSFTLIR